MWTKGCNWNAKMDIEQVATICFLKKIQFRFSYKDTLQMKGRKKINQRTKLKSWSDNVIR